MPAGTAFYMKKGLKPVTAHLPPDVHERLLQIAQREDRSLQKTLKRIIIEAVSRTGK
jgi:predicted transcriptional regulator